MGFGHGSDGWIDVFDDVNTASAHPRWVQLNFPTYNAANGTTWPALGNLDADVEAELVVGLGVGGGGWLASYQNPVDYSSFAQWTQLDFAPYNAAVGELHPAIGNIDGDPEGEIVVGLGRYNPPADSGGWLRVLDQWMPGFGVTYLSWVRIDHVPMQLEGVATWPAVGKIR